MYIIIEIIAKDNLNIANLMQTFENIFSNYKSAQKDSLIIHTNSPWVHVIKVCSDGGATYTLLLCN